MQEKIIKFLTLKKKTGRSFNSEVRNRKEYRNRDFLLHTVTYQDIDQIGSCFSKDVFNPHGYVKSDYYDEIGRFVLFYLAMVFIPRWQNGQAGWVETCTFLLRVDWINQLLFF